MATNSPNFNLVLATSADQVNVVTQVAGNFSTIDSVMALALNSTGLKAGLFLATPALSSPTITGAVTGLFSITASTGHFNTVTATGGAVTLNTLNIGTYSVPSTIGATGALLTVVTGNAMWIAPSGGTGANTGLSNLAVVAINTNLNTFSAGFVTVDRVIASSGALTGLTAFQATTGTFAGNLLVSGTATINAINCTGGAITGASIGIGTYSMPATLGTQGQVLRASGTNLIFSSPATTNSVAFSLSIPNLISVSGTTATAMVIFANSLFDPGSNVTTNGFFTAPTAGTYNFSAALAGSVVNVGGTSVAYIAINTTTLYNFLIVPSNTSIVPFFASMDLNLTLGSGNTVAVFIGHAGGSAISLNGFAGYFSGKRLYEF